MRPEGLGGATLALAQERDVGAVLKRIVCVVAAQNGVALARVWLIEAGDLCERCHVRTECGDRTRCLHLAASAGSPVAAGETWNGLDGAFRRFPLGAHKVGKVGATGAGILLHDMSERSAWILRPAWAAREGIRSFAAQPLAFGGRVLGVLGAFSRIRIDAEAFAWLRAFADHAAASIANARAFEDVDRRRVRLELENRRLREDAIRTLGGADLVGTSPALARVREQVALAAPTTAPVLVVGEPGTGKAVVARRIHAEGPRAAGPFIAVDCATLRRDEPLPLDAAEGGTLWLDEIAALPCDHQEAVLTVLRDGGRGPHAQRADVRVVATTGRDLFAEAAAGRFREDLAFRVSVVTIHVPPLRDRPGDVAPLVERFLRRAADRLGRPVLVPTLRDLRALERRAWPGNVRELAATVERAVILAADGHPRFDREATAPESAPVPAAEWRHRERANLEAALVQTGGRIYGRGGAAEVLGLPPTTLASRVKALGITRRPAS